MNDAEDESTIPAGCEIGEPAGPAAFDDAGPRAAPTPSIDRGSRRFEVADLADWLPRLGAVLWLDRAHRRRAPIRAAIGTRGLTLIDHPALAALARCTGATLHVEIASHGPREWIGFDDGADAPLAKLYLLPDTDYLAWDEMTAALGLAPTAREATRWHAHAAFLRQAFLRLGACWEARILAFGLRRLPWLQTLDARAPLRVSLLGLELAQSIARSEGAALASPLYAC